MAHKWAGSLDNTHITRAAWESPNIESGGQNHSWPISGAGGDITLAAERVTNTSEHASKSQVAHMWADWLQNTCRLRGPQRFKTGGKSEVPPKVRWMAKNPVPPRGSQTLGSKRQNHS